MDIYDDLPGASSGQNWPLEEQCKSVSAGLKNALEFGVKWEPVAISWMHAWREYSGFGKASDDEVISPMIARALLRRRLYLHDIYIYCIRIKFVLIQIYYRRVSILHVL